MKLKLKMNKHYYFPLFAMEFATTEKSSYGEKVEMFVEWYISASPKTNQEKDVILKIFSISKTMNRIYDNRC